MKKLILLIGILLFADNKYLEMTNELVGYHFKLKNIEKIKIPFEIQNIAIPKSENTKKVIRRVIKVELISIFNNKAYILLKEYLGTQLVKVKRKWVKVGDRIDKCRVTSITTDKLIIRCGKRTIIKSINKKIPLFKDKK